MFSSTPSAAAYESTRAASSGVTGSATISSVTIPRTAPRARIGSSAAASSAGLKRCELVDGRVDVEHVRARWRRARSAWVGVSPVVTPDGDAMPPQHRLGLTRLEVEHRRARHRPCPSRGGSRQSGRDPPRAHPTIPAIVFGLRPNRARETASRGRRHADGRHDPGEHRRPHGRAARHVREPRAGEVARPGAQGRPQRRSGVDEWTFQGEATVHAVRHGRHRRLARGGVGLQPRLVLRAAPRLLRRARAGARHERQRRARRR